MKQLELYYALTKQGEEKNFQRSYKSKFCTGSKKYMTFRDVCGALDDTPANNFHLCICKSHQQQISIRQPEEIYSPGCTGKEQGCWCILTGL